MSVLLKIGTRGSPLALVQAAEVAARLAAAHPLLAAPGAIETIVIRTTGDAVTDRTLAAIGGKGLFTKEIEDALLAGTIDLAVHSMKDVTTWLPAGLVVDCLLPREDPRDALFLRGTAPAGSPGLAALPPGAVVGTASLRRQAQVLHLRPDVTVVPIRGNVDTRLRKLEDGIVDATLLAMAGLKRLGRGTPADKRPPIPISTEEMLPAVAQGAIGIERRADNERVASWLAAINHAPTATCITAERAFLQILDGSCKTPIAALAELDEAGQLQFRGQIIRPDGSQVLTTARSGPAADAAALGHDAGLELKGRAGPGFFAQATPEAPVR
jgi:hydroxymethylbilane synthase